MNHVINLRSPEGALGDAINERAAAWAQKGFETPSFTGDFSREFADRLCEGLTCEVDENGKPTIDISLMCMTRAAEKFHALCLAAGQSRLAKPAEAAAVAAAIEGVEPSARLVTSGDKDVEPSARLVTSANVEPSAPDTLPAPPQPLATARAWTAGEEPPTHADPPARRRRGIKATVTTEPAEPVILKRALAPTLKPSGG